MLIQNIHNTKQYIFELTH